TLFPLQVWRARNAKATRRDRKDACCYSPTPLPKNNHFIFQAVFLRSRECGRGERRRPSKLSGVSSPKGKTRRSVLQIGRIVLRYGCRAGAPSVAAPSDRFEDLVEPGDYLDTAKSAMM